MTCKTRGEQWKMMWRYRIILSAPNFDELTLWTVKYACTYGPDTAPKCATPWLCEGIEC